MKDILKKGRHRPNEEEFFLLYVWQCVNFNRKE